MHLLGRHTIDERTLHVCRRFERWERFQRAQEAERVVGYVLDNRAKYALTARDLKRLDRWTDRVFALGLGAVPGGVAGAGAVLTPADVVDTANIWDWWRTDSGVTVGTGVASWVPIIGANTFSQAIGTKQPIFTLNDSTLFGRGSFVGDGTDDILTTTTPFSTPSVSVPVFHRLIFKNLAWVGGLAVFGTASSNHALNHGSTTPALLQRNTTAVNSNTGATLGAWVRVEAYFSGTTADSLRIGSTFAAGGVSAGATAPAASLSICARTSASYSQSAFAEYLLLKILPSSLQLALLDGLTADFYKSVPAL